MAEHCRIYCPCCGAFRSAMLTDGDGFIMPSTTEAAFICDECGTAWRLEFYAVETEDRDRAQQQEQDDIEAYKRYADAKGAR